MPLYIFRLHDGPAVKPVLETVSATSDDEARDLAHLRLSLSRAYTHVEVHHDGREVIRLKRDSQAPI
jgi:hypothetical protein